MKNWNDRKTMVKDTQKMKSLASLSKEKAMLRIYPQKQKIEEWPATKKTKPRLG
jgi:hypothetical protein